MSNVWVNLGCGKVTMPGVKPLHHILIPDEVYDPAKTWINVDHNAGENVYQADIFDFPLPFAENQFGGALLSHIVEHIPHVVDFSRKRDWANQAYKAGQIDAGQFGRLKEEYTRFEELGDGFYMFFSELHRILEPGAVAHVLSPYAFSTGAFQDPTHHRYITPDTFTYLVPNPDAPFELTSGGAWEIIGWNLGFTPDGSQLADQLKQQHMKAAQSSLGAMGAIGLLSVAPAPDSAMNAQLEQEAMQWAMNTAMQRYMNTVSDVYMTLRVVK